jgi:hypothetical protein
MSVPAGWREQDKQRHTRALAALAATGYGQDQPAPPQVDEPDPHGGLDESDARYGEGKLL